VTLSLIGFEGGLAPHGAVNTLFGPFRRLFAGVSGGQPGTWAWDSSAKTAALVALENVPAGVELAFSFSLINPLQPQPSPRIMLAIVGADALLARDMPPPHYTLLYAPAAAGDVYLSLVDFIAPRILAGDTLRVGSEMVRVLQTYTAVLVSAVNSTAVTITVTGAAAARITADTVIRIDDELLQVLSVSGISLSVTRGYFGSVSVWHGRGSTVYSGSVRVERGMDGTPAQNISGQSFDLAHYLSLPRVHPAVCIQSVSVSLCVCVMCYFVFPLFV
jgi:hypothetical protein